MSAGGNWRRVTPKEPCPTCEKPDWCCVTTDGAACCCMRVESPKRLRNGGWLHRLRENGGWRARPCILSVAVPARPTAGPDFGKLAEEYHKAVNPFDLVRFASDMGVCRWALMRLCLGWATAAQLRTLGTKCSGPGCWTWPMRSAGGRAAGIRLRAPSGFKYSVRGSQQGLFLPPDLPDGGPLLVAEGPTDTAALLQLEFATIGRPSCSGAVQLVCDFARGRRVVVVADGDGPGQRGAEVLARALRLHCRDVRVIRPPDGTKDARAWVCSGATPTDVRTAIDAAEPVRMTIETNAAGC